MKVDSLIEKAWETRKIKIKGHAVPEFLPNLNCEYLSFHDRIPVFAGILQDNEFNELHTSIKEQYHRNEWNLPDNADAIVLNTRIVKDGYGFEISYATQPSDDFSKLFVPRAAEMSLMLKTLSPARNADKDFVSKINSYLKNEKKPSLDELRSEIKEEVRPAYANVSGYQFRSAVQDSPFFYLGILASINEEREMTARDFFDNLGQKRISPYAPIENNPVFLSLKDKFN